MKPTSVKAFTAAMATGIMVGVGLLTGGPATAYTPAPGDVFVAQNQAACNKNPCVLYPKAAQLPSGRILAAFEDSQQAVVGQTMPVVASDDDGNTWRRLADVKAPAYASSDPQYAKYTSNWTNPYLYVLPQRVGDLAAGTALLATVVSGDDEYAKEQKAADPNWKPTGDGDRRDLAVALYSSSDNGATWTFRNIIGAGGWQGGSAGAIGRTSAANKTAQVDPVWEPHLLAQGGNLIAYYSDENDYLSYNTTTGVPTIDPDNATASDSHGQVLVHKTWNGAASATWSAPVIDVAGTTVDRGNGKTQIGGGRPGMTTVAPTVDGKWILTFEYFGGGQNTKYKVSSDPLRFFADGDNDGTDIGQLPVPSGQAALAAGGSPVLTTTGDGRIVYNAAGSGSVWVNDSGRSDGQWKEQRTTLPGGYSRNLTFVQSTGRMLVLQAAWAGGSVGPVKFAEVDLGRSNGVYYSIVNRATGQALSPEPGRTQDASFTGNTPDIVTRSRSAGDDQQRWHTQAKGNATTFLNKAGGRALGIWQGNATAGQRLAQWVDDDAADKRWTVEQSTDGYVKIRSTANTAQYVTGASNGSVTLGTALGSGTADDAQEWQLVADPQLTDAPFSLKGAGSGRCLDIPNGTVGAQAQIWDCVGNANQRITATAAGELRIGSNCLAVDNDGTTAGTRLILWTCNGATSQKWSFRVDGTIASRSNGLVIDVGGFATANGSPVSLWSPLSGTNQIWSRI